MHLRRRLLIVAIVLASAGLLAGATAWRPTPARAAEPPPTWTVFLPAVMKPFHAYMPNVSTGTGVTGAHTFLGVNGGPIDGGAGTGAAPGFLAYFPTLRKNSLSWLTTAGVRWYRNYGSDAIVYSWRFVEPNPDQYDWTFWDTLVQQSQAQDINLLASIGDSVPAWANGTSDWRQPPSDLYSEPMQNTAWYKYVYAFVQRYNGDGVADMPGLTKPIKSWEFWNEPDLREGWNPPNYPPHQFAGSVNDLVRLRAVGYAAVKAADPSAVVVGPATAQMAGYTSQYVGSVPWFIWSWSEFMSAGGLNTVDAVSFTHYFVQNNWDVPSFDEPDFVLSLADSGRGGKPVWFTESGWKGDPVVNYQDKARNIVRLTVMMWSVPWVQHLFWYNFQEQSLLASNYHKALIQTTTGSQANGVEPDPLFHPAYRTAELMQKILGGFSLDNHPALQTTDATRVGHFSANGLDVWVAWLRADSGSATVSIDTGGQTTRMIGLYGQDLGLFSGGSFSVGPDPVYLTTSLQWNPNVGRITGRLHDASRPSSFDNGVVGATVVLTGPGGPAGSTLSDSDGNYQFSALPDGDYHVSVQGLAANPASYDITVDRQRYWGQTSFAVTVP